MKELPENAAGFGIKKFLQALHRPALLHVAVWFVCATVSLGANWPAFRGASTSGVAAGAPPTTWDVDKGTNVAWQTQIPGMGHSSPIVWGNRVYVTTAVPLSNDAATVKLGDSSKAGIDSATDTGAHEWRLIALDRATGRVIWNQLAHRGVPRIKRHVKASHASATPATDGRFIVALMGSEGLFCFDPAGKLVWQKDLGTMDVGLVDDPTYQWGPASSPVIAGDRVLVQNDQHKNSFLAAFDLATGRELWRTPRNEMPSWATPVVARTGARSIVVTTSPRGIRGQDLATGQEVWHFADETQVKVPSPVIAGNLAIATGGYAPGTRPTFAIPLAATGTVTSRQLAWQIDRGSPYTSTPLVYDGILYMVTDAGVLSAHEAATGARLYQARIGEGGLGFSASPVAANGRIYFASEDGDVFVIRAGKTFAQEARNSVPEMTMATPAIDGNLLIVRTGKRVIALGTI